MPRVDMRLSPGRLDSTLIALAAHSSLHPEGLQLFLEVTTGVLAAAIGVEDQPGCRTPPEPRHPQGIDHKLARLALVHGKAHDLSAEQVDDDSQIQPALFRPDIGDVVRRQRL